MAQRLLRGLCTVGVLPWKGYLIVSLLRATTLWHRTLESGWFDNRQDGAGDVYLRTFWVATTPEDKPEQRCSNI